MAERQIEYRARALSRCHLTSGCLRLLCLRFTLSKTDTFRTWTKCPSYRESTKMSKSNEEWSSQLWTQFMQLSKKAEKNSGLQRGLNSWHRGTVRCGFLRNSINSVHKCKDHSSFDFISAVLIWFISWHMHIAYGMTDSQQGALDFGVPASLDSSIKDLFLHKCKMLCLYPLSGHCQLVTVIASYVYHKLDSQLPTLATLLLKRMCLVRPL